MDKNNYSHVPVYDKDEKYIWLLAESKVLARLIEGSLLKI